jgi:hypothetical protein
MATIRVIYEAEPDFPATQHHPDAVRYQVGEYWVDAVGGAPAQVEKDLEALARVLYRERREQREEIARIAIERAATPR